MLHKLMVSRALKFAAVAAMIAALSVPGGVVSATAAPTTPTDATVVPHYFGPWANWANSPLTLSTAAVTIGGPGSGATGVAEVDPVTGGIKSVAITSPGHDYGAGTTVSIGGSSGTPATASATISMSGVVIGFTGIVSGGGYTSFDTVLNGGGGSGATAIASGGVDAIAIGSGGAGYVMPTIDFDLPDDPNGTIAKAHVPRIANGDATDGLDGNGTVTAVVIDDPGAGYTTAPAAAILNGTQFDPVPLADGGSPADITTTLALSAVNVLDFGTGYTSAPSVAINDPLGSGAGAAAAALSDIGAVTAISVESPGDGYLTQGMKKFVDDLPVTCTPGDAANNCPTAPGAKFIPNGVPQEKTYNGVKADEYVIGLVQYRTSFSSEIPQGTLVRGYVQLETADNASISQHVALTNELQDGTRVPVAGGYFGVTSPQYLGPFIGASKNKPVRVVFRNLLPTGTAGDLFLPTDSSMMGSGMGPMAMMDPTDNKTVTDEIRNPACSEFPKPQGCFADNRATLHLHGGITPWISDGTPHQWITPANQSTEWPQGVSVENVPDMTEADGSVTCAAADDGCSTFFYTNQQSARMMFYHDHSWGITRLNVYAGEAAGYTITDDAEKKLVADGVIPGPADTLPLVFQDKTFVPSDGQLYDTQNADGTTATYGQDPTWNKARWGGAGSLWYHHVYMPAQNPGDPSGMSAYGRWMYGPWFWPPASDTKYGTIPNPYHDPACKLDVPSTWTYQTDPFCEPEEIPGTPNVSAGMEQFNDTPVVNGVAYPKVTLEPKSYRMRMLNAANDRFFNFQWYVADPDPANGNGKTEVKLNEAELAAAQTDTSVSPTPADAHNNAAGPDWIQIASEGGFLPAPAVLDGQQPATFITDPTRFDVGNVDKHSMLIAPAERADAIVDFSKYAGKTLILYNDAPAAFPARVPSYDYYTGAPDMRPVGAPTPLPGYGPNTRTIMQVTIAASAPAPAFNLPKLQAAFRHNASGTGVFESSQHPVIVGQAAYNSTYGTSFAASSNCNAPNSTSTRCDGLVRVSDTMNFGFNTLKAQNAKMTLPLGPKALHDEMNSTTFDEYGRMSATIGIEAQPPTPGAQNVTLYPFTNPATELIDGTNLPQVDFALDANGLPAKDVKVSAISSATDGTQIWRFTHNGVDTHPIHFHLYDVQLVNRVTWDNIIIPPEPAELGWKDTVRMSPLEDTIVALRPIIPKVPFEVPNAIRPLNPMMPIGSTAGFNNTDPQGNPTSPIANALVNFGWDYILHCHILSHEEMDMMRPVSLAMPPRRPDGLATAMNGTGSSARVVLTWNDNSISETAFMVQRTTVGSTTWTDVQTIPSPLDQPNLHGVRSFTDTTADGSILYRYRVVALNTVGYGGAYPSLTVSSVSDEANSLTAPAAPTNLAASLQAGPGVVLTWQDNANNESGFVVERSADAGATFTTIATTGAAANTGTYTDTTPAIGTTYAYRVTAVNAAGTSAPSNTITIGVLLPGTPAGVTAIAARQGNTALITAKWTDVLNETGYTIQWSTTQAFTSVAGSGTAPADATTFTTPAVSSNSTWWIRVRGSNVVGVSAWSTPVMAADPAAAPTNLTATLQSGPRVRLTWRDNATNETGFVVERSTDAGATFTTIATPGVNRNTGTVTWTDTTTVTGTTYAYRVRAVNAAGPSAPSNTVTVGVLLPGTPAGVTGTAAPRGNNQRVTVAWGDVVNETGYTIQWSTTQAFTRVSGSGTAAANATTFTTPTISSGSIWWFRVRSTNVIGASAWSTPVMVGNAAAAPTILTATLQSGPRVRLTWRDNATNETGFVVERSADAGATFTTIATPGANRNTGTVTYTDTTPVAGNTYSYRITAVNAAGTSVPSNTVAVGVLLPGTPSGITGSAVRSGNNERVTVNWGDVVNETGYTIQWSTTQAFTRVAGSGTAAANATSFTTGRISRSAWWVRVSATNGLGTSAWSAPVMVTSA
ncbi:multicopper oxidase domain-containing protein [Tessaracoccus sp.]